MTRRTRDRRVKRHTPITSPREFGFKPMNEEPDPDTFVTRAQLATVMDMVQRLVEEVARLSGRVNLLEMNKSGTDDSITGRIFEFLKTNSPMKFNTGSIAINLDLNSGQISDRVKQMAKAGKIHMSKVPGQSAAFWYQVEVKENEDE